MERDEERPDAEPEEEGTAKKTAARKEPAEAEGPGKPVAGGESTKARTRGSGSELAVVLSAAMIVVALAAFVAGFAVHALLDEDDEGGTAAVAQPSPAAGTPSALPTVTPPPVVAATADDDPFIGPDDAAVTVIEFSDYQWSFCKRFRDETLDQVLETYEGKIKFVMRDFPLTSIHQYAQKAAEATECADDQGKFWEYHDIVFDNQAAIDVDSLKGYAAELGLDTATFNDCLDTGEHSAEVEKDSEDARSYGATGTPAFFINGQLLSGAQPFSVFQQVIDAALAEEE